MERDEYNKQVKILKKKRDALNKLKKENKVDSDQNKSVSTQAMKLHHKIKTLAARSQECQVEMVDTLREARMTRTKADKTHAKIKEQIAIIREFRAQTN